MDKRDYEWYPSPAIDGIGQIGLHSARIARKIRRKRMIKKIFDRVLGVIEFIAVIVMFAILFAGVLECVIYFSSF